MHGARSLILTPMHHIQDKIAYGGKSLIKYHFSFLWTLHFISRKRRERERMAPKKKSDKSTAPPAVTTSPRRTRSATAGKPVVPPPAKAPAAAKWPAKKQKVAKEEKKAEDVAPPAASEGSSEAIIIEACKQCNSFKTRANIVKEGLESAVSGIDVSINPEKKPRRGCFEIRKAGGEVCISLLDMKRPFTPMKNLDMDKVVEDIVKKIK